jgi:hypothetical protein
MSKRLFIIGFILLSFLVMSPQKADASILDDVVSGVKKFIFGEEKKEVKKLSLEASIQVVPGGDQNKNGIIDPGDEARFSFVIKNPTDKEYAFLNLNTGIDKKLVNFIHNYSGMSSIGVKSGKVIIQNIRILSGQESVLSFDARVNLSSKNDLVLSVEPMLVSQNSILVNAPKQQRVVKKISKEALNKRIDSGSIIKTNE